MDPQELAASKTLVKAKVLRQEPDPRARLARAERRAEHRARSAARLDQAEQQLDGRRLARAVRA
jgi:hypothetical protein